MAHRHVITAAFAVLFALLFLTTLGPPLSADPGPPAESPDQQLIHAILAHDTHFGGIVFRDKYSSLPPDEARAARQKLVLADVQTALAAGASPNAKAGAEISGAPALMLAAQRGYTDVVRLLLDKGANASALNQWGDQTLQMVHDEVPLAIVQMLILKGANINKDMGSNMSPFRWFIQLGRPDVVEFMLLHGANVDPPNYSGETPLMLAAEFGQLNIIKLLLLYGADIHARDSDNDTAMYWAAASYGRVDNTAVLQFFIERGLSVNQKSRGYRSTPLQMASLLGNVANVKWLLSHGADVKSKNRLGTTALSAAQDGTKATYGDGRQRFCTEIIRLLKAAGAKD